VQGVGELAEAEGHHPEVCFGWGHATVSLQTRKIKGLHENGFILAAKIDRLATGGASPRADQDTVGEIVGLAESRYLCGKSARVVAQIRTERGSCPYLAQP
jgi:hypothetical protein